MVDMLRTVLSRSIRKMAEKKQGNLDRYFSLKKTQSEPPHGENLTRERIRGENHGDPESNKHGQKYLCMPLEERRKLYKCGGNYVTLEDFVIWPVLWHIKQDSLQRKCKALDVSYSVNELLNKKICLHQGDITKLEIDAIVNAANTSLLGGGGVDGAIHRAAGSSLYDECKSLNGCNTGDAKITSGHRLPAKYIIHTVGPFGRHPDLLGSCYKKCLEMASKFNIKTLAFPCISTGVYGYPQVDAAHVALRTIREWLENKENAERVQLIIICVYLSQDWNIYTDLLQSYFPCKTSSAPSQTSKDKQEISELEADVLNIENIPKVDDFSELLEEEEANAQKKSEAEKSNIE